jgi:hypothetical protein
VLNVFVSAAFEPSSVQVSEPIACRSVAVTVTFAGAALNQPFEPFGVWLNWTFGPLVSSFRWTVPVEALFPAASAAVQTTRWSPSAEVAMLSSIVVAVIPEGPPSEDGEPSVVQLSESIARPSTACTCSCAGAVVNQPFAPFGVCDGVTVGGVVSSFRCCVAEVDGLPALSVAEQTTRWSPSAEVWRSPPVSVAAFPSSVHESVATPDGSLAETWSVAGAVLNQPFEPSGVCENENAGPVVSSFRCCVAIGVLLPAAS